MSKDLWATAGGTHHRPQKPTQPDVAATFELNCDASHPSVEWQGDEWGEHPATDGARRRAQRATSGSGVAFGKSADLSPWRSATSQWLRSSGPLSRGVPGSSIKVGRHRPLVLRQHSCPISKDIAAQKKREHNHERDDDHGGNDHFKAVRARVGLGRGALCRRSALLHGFAAQPHRPVDR